MRAAIRYPADGGSRLVFQQQLVQLPGVGPKASGALTHGLTLYWSLTVWLSSR